MSLFLPQLSPPTGTKFKEGLTQMKPSKDCVSPCPKSLSPVNPSSKDLTAVNLEFQPVTGRLSPKSSPSPPPSPPGIQVQVSSFEVFLEFLTINKDGSYNADKIFSKQCYHRWLATRQKVPKLPEESFRRAITAHIRGTNGRKPFSEAQERAVLKILRKRERWNCFDSEQNIGKLGYQKLGFHEEKSLGRARKTSLKRGSSGTLYPETAMKKVRRLSLDSLQSTACMGHSPTNSPRVLTSFHNSSLGNGVCLADHTVSPLSVKNLVCFCNRCVLTRIKLMDYQSYVAHLQTTTALLLEGNAMLQNSLALKLLGLGVSG